MQKRGRALERKREVKRGGESEQKKMLSRVICGWWFLFAVNNLEFPSLFSACSASDTHVCLMLTAIKYVTQWMFKNGYDKM